MTSPHPSLHLTPHTVCILEPQGSEQATGMGAGYAAVGICGHHYHSTWQLKKPRLRDVGCYHAAEADSRAACLRVCL